MESDEFEEALRGLVEKGHAEVRIVDGVRQVRLTLKGACLKGVRYI